MWKSQHNLKCQVLQQSIEVKNKEILELTKQNIRVEKSFNLQIQKSHETESELLKAIRGEQEKVEQKERNLMHKDKELMRTSAESETLRT